MKISKEDKIRMIQTKYKVTFPPSADESILDDILKNKYHRLELINLAKRGDADKFDRSDMNQFPTNQLFNLAEKYSKRELPSNLKRELLEDILLKKFKIDGLTTRDLKVLGKKARSTAMNSLDLYTGWIPKVGKFIDKRDLKRGEREAKRLSR